MASPTIRIAILANARNAIRGLGRTARAVAAFDRRAKAASRGGTKDLANSINKLGDVAKRAGQGLATAGRVLGKSYMGFVAVGIVAGTAQIAAAITATLVGALPAAGVLPGVALVAASAISVLKVAMMDLSETIGLGFAQALTGNKSDILAFQKRLELISPAARKVVLATVKLQPAMIKFRNAVQKVALKGFAGQIADLARIYLPLFQRHATKVATSLNRAGNSIGHFFQQGSTIRKISKIFDTVATSIDGIAKGLPHLARGFLPLLSVSTSFLPGLDGGFAKVAKRFADFMEHAEKTGALKAFIQGGIDALKAIGGLIANVGSILKSVFVDANAGAGNMFGMIGTLIKQVADFLNTTEGMKAVGAIWSTLNQVGRALGGALGKILPDLGKAIGEVGPVVGTLAESLAGILKAVSPVLPVVGKLAAIVGNTLARALDKLAPALGILVSAMGDSLLKIIPPLGDVIVVLAEGVAGLVTGLSPILPVVAGVVAALLKGLTPVLKQLMPVVSILAKTIGEVLLKVLKALEPVWPVIISALAELAPSVVSLTEALAPVIVTLTDLWAVLFSAVVPVLVALMPIVVKVVKVLASIVVVASRIAVMVTKSLIPAFELLTKAVSFVTEAFTRFREWMYDLAGNVIDSLVNGFQAGWHKVTEFFDQAIQLIPQGIRDALGIASPSKVMAGIGKNIVGGLAVGIRKQVPAVSKAMGAVSSAVSGGVATNAAISVTADGRAAPASSGPASMVFNINVNVAANADPAEAGRRIVAAIEAWQARTGRKRLLTA